VTDVGELAAATGAGGLVVPPRDPLALAEAGRRIVEEAGLLVRLEAGVKGRVEGELSWADIAGRTEEFYHATIAGHRA
jgi:glycosyltransferase involved in cell wall biosynthesis